MMLSLTYDNIDFDCAYLIDNGDVISLFIFNSVNPQFYQDLFGVETYEEAVQAQIEALDENNMSDLNQRILNIVGQLRKDNKGKTQPVRLMFLE